MLLSNFNSIFELSVALNIGYASIPQLASNIYNIAFKKLFSAIDVLEKKSEPAKSMLSTIEDDKLSEEVKKSYEKRIDREVRETVEIKENLYNATEVTKNSISSHMRFYFLLVASLSILFLIVAAYSSSNNDTFPQEAIFNIYLVAFIIIITRYSFIFYKPSMDRKILIGIFVVIVMFVCYYFDSDFINFMKSLSIPETFQTGFILCTLLLPFLITILLYIKASYVITKEYKPQIEQQVKDIEEDLKNIKDAAVDQDAISKIQKLAKEN